MGNKEKYFEQIYQEQKDKIYRLCLGFMGNKNDADDLFQEVLIKVWKGLDSFRQESSVHTWVYRIATNTALQSINKSKSTEKKLLPIGLKTEVDTVDEPDKQIQISKLYKAISTLKEIDRIIIGLLLEENSYKEIAEITGIEVSNVGVRINRIKKKLMTKIR